MPGQPFGRIHLLVRLMAMVLLGSFRLQTPSAEDPAVVVRRLTRAAEADRLTTTAAPYRRELARHSTDRTALFGTATATLLAYDYRAADTLFQAVVASRATPDRLTAFAELGMGFGLYQRSAYERAAAAFQRAINDARAAHAADAEAEALIVVSQLRVRTMGVAAARAALDSAARLIAALPASPFKSRLAALRACAAAYLHVRLATPGARDTAIAGAALARAAGEPRIEASCAFAEAQEYERQGNFEQAGQIMRVRVEPLMRVAHHRHSLAAVLQWHGYVAIRLGAYAYARLRLNEAVREAEASGNGAAIAWSYLGLANVAIDVGDLAAAGAHLTRARTLMAEQRDRWGAATARGLEADVAWARGSIDDARAGYHETIDSLIAIGNPYATLERYRSLAMLEQEQRRWDDAERWLDAADRLARGRVAPGWYNERRVHDAANAMGRGELSLADSLLSVVLGVLSHDGAHANTYFEYLSRHAEVLARRKDLDGAEQRLTKASEMFDRWRAMQGSDREYRIALLQARKTFGLSGAGVPYAIGALARGGRVEAAFRFAEERRARDLVTVIASRDAAADGGATRIAPARGIRAPAPVAALADVGRALPESTALLEYVTGRGDEAVSVLIVTRTGARVASLPPLDSLGALARRLATLIAAGEEPTSLARTLGERVLGPVMPLLPPDVSRLVIVPDGPLHKIPFDALRMADDRWLIERYAVTIAPSATTLVRLRARDATRRPATLLAFGDPAYDRVPAGGHAEELRANFAAAGGLPRLPSSAREVRAIARYFARAEVRLGADASEAALRTLPLRKASVIHFATHAIVDDNVRWRSALALAPGGGHDGFVGAAELAALDIDADLVVLSGCRTAEGEILVGEGVQGLTAPLFEAGAHAVLATRWQIRDRDAGPMVERFYKAMANGLAAGDALQQAKVEALRDGVNTAVWAAFALVGDPGVTPLPRGARR